MNKPLFSPGRSAASLDLPLGAPRTGESKQSWVYREIRQRILRGLLPAGTRLPSTRSLAQAWCVARSTVEAAYDQLRSEGYSAGSVGSGTYVAAVIPDNFFHRGVPGEGRQGKEASLSARGRERNPRGADAALFPMMAWARALAAGARQATPAQLAIDDAQGWRGLREQIARYLGAARGIHCDPDCIVVLAGIRDGLDLSARLLLTAGDKVLVEDPGYLTAYPIFSRYTDQVLPLAIDAQGFPVAAARRQRGVRLVHVTPAHQSPTGITMPVSRRLELLAWAEQQGCWILEDDYDSEFNYEGAPLAALKSLDAGERVIHCGSFNKTLYNALRIGYAVVPGTLVERFVQARRDTGRAASIIEQMALAELLRSGGFARHVRKARNVYARRRDQVLQCLRQAVGEASLRVSGAQAGFHLVWWPPPGWDVTALLGDPRAAELGLRPITAFSRRVQTEPGIVIGFSALDDTDMETLAAWLAQN